MFLIKSCHPAKIGVKKIDSRYDVSRHSNAQVVKLVDTPDLGSGASQCGGSSPLLGNPPDASSKEKRPFNLAMILYIYSKCSTCQSALKFLEWKNVSFVRKEIIGTPPSVEELRTMLHYMEGNIKKIFNISGQLYRDMQLSEKLKSMSEESAILLLSQHGMLVKRPFLLGDDYGLLGFKETEWSKKI